MIITATVKISVVSPGLSSRLSLQNFWLLLALIGKLSLNHCLGKCYVSFCTTRYGFFKLLNVKCIFLGMLCCFGQYSSFCWWPGQYLDSSLLGTCRSNLTKIKYRFEDVTENILCIFRNADRWLEEQRRRLLWLRAKSIELGIYSPETNDRLENPDEAGHLESPTDNQPRSSPLTTKPKKRRVNKAD